MTSSAYRAFGVTALAFVSLLLTMQRDLNMFDEGIILVNALRVMDGDLIHRDFYSNYGPGQSYLVAALFKLFGTNLLVGRLYGIATLSAIVGILFHILDRRIHTSFALLAAAICGMWTMSFNQYLYPVYPCILFALAGSYLILPTGKAVTNRRRLMAAGACTGLIALFRYDSGFFVMTAHLIALAILPSIQADCRRRSREIALDGAAYCLGVALLFLPPAFAFLTAAPLDSFIADIIDYPRKHYAEMRALPFPSAKDIIYTPHEGAVYLPLLAALLAAVELIRQLSARSARPTDADNNGAPTATRINKSYLVVFGILAVILFFKGVVRVSALHMMMGIIPALIVFAVLADAWWILGGRRNGTARASTALMLLVVIVPAADAVLREANRARNDSGRSLAGWLLTRDNEMAGCTAVKGTTPARVPSYYLRVARYLIAHSHPTDRIFVGLSRHDKIFANAVALYFVAGRLPGTHWHHFDPGLQTRADIQAQMVADLRRNAVDWVIRDESFDWIVEQNGSARSSGVEILDDYLNQNYRMVASAGKVSILLTKDKSLPPISDDGVKCLASPVDSSFQEVRPYQDVTSNAGETTK